MRRGGDGYAPCLAAAMGPSFAFADPGTELSPERILDVFADEAHVERSRLTLQTRVDELGLASLDLALTLFELEDRYEVELPGAEPGAPQPTLGEVVQQVMQQVMQRRAAGAAY